MRGSSRAVLLLFFLFFLLFVFPSVAQLLAATIFVDADQVLSPVNPLIFGNAQPFGHGDVLLQSGSTSFDPQALNLVSALKPTVLRFPGGIHADEYFWEDGIGPLQLRPDPRPGQYQPFGFDYGIDEHMALCEEIGAEAFITINYGSGVLGDSLSTAAPLSQRISRAADWVEYCNTSNDGCNPNGGIDWAARRAENGHPEPYAVKFWELGNEIYIGQQTGHTEVETYAQDVIAFSQAMKAVDPDIKIGAVGVMIPHASMWWDSIPLEWNATLLRIAHQDIDFLVVHAHYPGSWNLPDSAEDLYRAGLAGANQALVDLEEIRRIIDQEADSSIGIVPGENGFFGGVGGNYHLITSLLAGLHLADLLMLFLEQSSALNISFACGWTLHSKTYGGDIAYKWSPERRFARPEYYAQQMFREHFGEALVASTLDCGTFSTVEAAKVQAMPAVPELSVCTSIDSAGTKLYLMVLNKQLDQDVEATIQVAGFEPQPEAHIWTLNGPSITANNEEDPNTVTIVPSTFDSASTSFQYTFPAHSLTAIQLTRSVEDSSPPTISNVIVGQVIDSSAQVAWQTDKPADSKVAYGTAPGECQYAVEDSILTEEHFLVLEPLQSETRYYFRVTSCDAVGNTATSEEDSFWTADVTSPEISQVEVTDITESTAAICWWTDEPADSRVEYHQEGELPQTMVKSDLNQEHHIALQGLQPATQCSFWVSSADSLGNLSEPQRGSFVTAPPRSETADSSPSDPMPSSYKLWQNFPNPFNASTNIRYHLPQEAWVAVKIYNALGQLVKTLVEEHQPPGERQVSWDGRDDQNGEVASGVYFCYLLAGDFRQMCKMTLLR